MEDSKQSPQVKPSGELPSILNPKFPNSNAIFHLFPKLSTELREMIWEQSLTCERYIKVQLCTINKSTGRRCRMSGKVRRLTGPYQTLLHYAPKRSALFSTSVESRASAQRFYRVVLPCLYVRKSPSTIDSLDISEQNVEHNPQISALSYVPPSPHTPYTKDQVLMPGTFSLNPELDTFEIDGWPLLANFASDIWNHDPRRAGLCHIAFPCDLLSSTLEFCRLPQYAISEEQLRQVLTRLRSVTFIHYTVVDRIFLANTEAHKYPANRQPLLQYGCSLPVAGARGNFSRQQDPRLIGHEVLKSIYFDLPSILALTNPHQRWTEMVEKLRVTTSCVYKIAYTTERFKSRISCESEAVAFLKHESEGWSKQLDKWEESLQEHGRRRHQKTAEHFRGAVETAIGFWTFPIESCGQFSQVHNPSEHRLGCFYDLSAARPELCLFDL
ncbi:hypothetical protein FPHYL_6135 [Fusarium phyllophilum]|uniref:2EXR domain-containing protein n=1 Tax=Fusarium phyllophilum TaxID=47803 RepID=A0A8H5JTL1_9HYPO|nr:hypothetical protein FPHYL_6135 [Fusarium phyllophilum]